MIELFSTFTVFAVLLVLLRPAEVVARKRPARAVEQPAPRRLEQHDEAVGPRRALAAEQQHRRLAGARGREARGDAPREHRRALVAHATADANLFSPHHANKPRAANHHPAKDDHGAVAEKGKAHATAHSTDAAGRAVASVARAHRRAWSAGPH